MSTAELKQAFNPFRSGLPTPFTKPSGLPGPWNTSRHASSVSWSSPPSGCGIHAGLREARQAPQPGTAPGTSWVPPPPGHSLVLCYTTLGWLLAPRGSSCWGPGLAQEGHSTHPHREVSADPWLPRPKPNPWGFYKGSLLLALTRALLFPSPLGLYELKRPGLRGDR